MVGRLNFNCELLPIRCSDCMFNLSKVNIDDACYVSVSYAGVFFFFVSFFKSGLMKWYVINKAAPKRLRNCNFQIVAFLLYAHYPIFSFYHTNNIVMLYLVQECKKKFESSNLDLIHSYIVIFTSFSS